MAVTRQKSSSLLSKSHSPKRLSHGNWTGAGIVRQLKLKNAKPEVKTAMKFMMLVKTTENLGPPPKALLDASNKMAEEATKAGQMLQTGGLAPTAMSSRVRLSNGTLTAIDGPFAETKEVVGGFAVFELTSREEAIESVVKYMELYKQFWPGWEGEIEIRQIFGPEDSPLKCSEKNGY